MTCMYYSSTNLCGVTPNHTLYNERKYIQNGRESPMTSAFFSELKNDDVIKKSAIMEKNEIVNFEEVILLSIYKVS